MKADCSRQYHSARFTILRDVESGTVRKNYFICFIIATLFVCLTAAYLCYKIFVAPTYFCDENPLCLSNDTTDSPKHTELKLYNPKPLLAGFRRKTSEDHWEITCEESQLEAIRLEAIPEVFIREILGKKFDNIHDYINLDLLLHYENIINRNGPTRLKVIFNEYQLKLSLVENSRDFLNFLTILKSSKLIFYVNNFKNSLELIYLDSFFALTYELNHWYNYLSRLDMFLSGYDQQKKRDYFVNCTRENFEKFSEYTQQRLFHFVYPFSITDKKLQEINDVINEWAKPVKIVFYNSSVVFQSKVLLLSELNRQIRKLNISLLKSVYFFASHTIFLDEDVELLGVDLAITSPNWVALGKIKINLNGLDGENSTSDADSDQPGKPGNPGGNAGDFLGVGNPYEKFLIITANGGKGGNGQNGAKGRDGANNTRPGPPFNKPACMTKENVFKNTFGQIITHYKVYGQSGCGSPGTDGGVGGQGGAGGVISLISKNSVKVKKGLNGTTGSYGKGGHGGIGGRTGCFYEVLDVDDEILHRVTRVKCLPGNILPNGDFGKDNHNAQGQVFPPIKKNLNFHECVHRFIRFTGGDFVSGTISLLKLLSQFDENNPSDVKDFVREYKLLEAFDEVELYDAFIELIDKYLQQTSDKSILSYLKSVLLGRMTILKENINYYFIDFKKYLSMLKTDIKSTNENTRQFQAITYLKRKVQIKIEEVRQNLRQIRFWFAEAPYRNNHTNCIMIVIIDLLQTLPPSTASAKRPELNDLYSACWLNLNADTVNNRKISGEALQTNEEKKVFEILKNIANKANVRGHLEQLRDSLHIVIDADVLSEEEKNLLEALTDELEHFIALYYFVEWEEIENLFLKSLHDLISNTDSELEPQVQFLKERLLDVMVGVQYSLASRQNLYPPKRTTRLQSKAQMEDVLTRISLLEDNASQGTDSFCRNHLKAVFDENSAAGEFYFWPNMDITNKLRILFSGTEIVIKSNLINRHVFDMNFVQFTSLKLKLECRRNRDVCQEELNAILNNFKIELTHSGYSYYNWNGETHIVVSDKVNLYYSFRIRDNKEPEIYNALYRKCQDGEIRLSPFTTWTMRLLPINDEADFNKLYKFADEVNLRLIGSGTYVS